VTFKVENKVVLQQKLKKFQCAELESNEIWSEREVEKIARNASRSWPTAR